MKVYKSASPLFFILLFRQAMRPFRPPWLPVLPYAYFLSLTDTLFLEHNSGINDFSPLHIPGLVG